MSTIRYRIRPGGPWQRILPGVYLTVSGTPTKDQLDMAALLYAGPYAILTGHAALRRYGIQPFPAQVVDVLVASVHCRRASRSYVRIHRTVRLPDLAAVVGEIKIATVPRAVIDAALDAPSVRVIRAIVAAAVQQRMCSAQQLEAELGPFRLRNSPVVRAVIQEVTAGIRSAPEGELMDLVKRAGLPDPLYNPRLYVDGKFLAAPDAWWREVSVAVEVDSVEWHLSPERWQATMERHARMAAAGIRVLHFSPRQIRSEPDVVIARIREALRTGAPNPRIQARPATR
jgi:hypothetical protein